MDALSKQSGGSGNVAIGRKALFNCSEGDNVAVGGYALAALQAGGENTAIGWGAGGSGNSNGYYNTAIGYEALKYAASYSGSNYNVGVGWKAFDRATNSTVGVVAIGKEAGAGVDNGTHSVFIGYEAAHTNTYNNANCIVIGGNANPSSNSVSNEITLGDANITRLRVPGIGLDLTSAPPTLANGANNRVVTASSSSALNGDANLTFDGSGQLTIAHTDPKIALVDTTNNTDAYIFSDDNGSLRFQADQNSEASDTRIRFQTDGTERVSIDSNLTILNGNLVVGTSGKGIDFSATGDASSSESTTSMSNELFDDYEVGSWQPTWSPASGSIGYIARHGDYVKIGRTVHCMFAISANGSTSPTGELKITGLPFSATIPNANGPRGGGGVVFPGSGMSGDISKVICSGTTMRIQMNDGSFLQTNNSSISYGYNAAQISGMFSFITAS